MNDGCLPESDMFNDLENIFIRTFPFACLLREFATAASRVWSSCSERERSFFAFEFCERVGEKLTRNCQARSRRVSHSEFVPVTTGEQSRLHLTGSNMVGNLKRNGGL